MITTGSELTGLFSATAPTRRGFPGFAISIALHGIGIALLSYGLLYNPVIKTDPISSNYKVRHLDLHVPETAASRAAEALYPTQKLTPHPEMPPHGMGAGDGAAEQTARNEPHPRAVPAIRLPEGGNSKATLIQPEIRTHMVLSEEAPVPTVMIWTPEVKTTPRVVPPPPDRPTTANDQTSVEVPNEELNPAELPLAATNRPSTVQAPPAGSTSPVAMKGATDVHIAPSTVSRTSDPPTPAAVLSISDLRMNEGTAVLPPLNEARGKGVKDGIATGQPTSALGANGGATAGAGTTGGGNAGGGSAASGNAAGGTAGSARSLSKGTGTAVADAQRTGQEPSAAGETAEHIQLPKDGKFSVIVVGSSLSDRYPEIEPVWSDRVAYTAYLHVGTPKAWILQYAQLRSVDAAAGGAVTQLVAPWPYDIMRPNLLSRDLNADALMVHGVLNELGRLENLAIAYPQGYIHGSFVLGQLRQWQFRPAQQQGKPTAVEVLLIIPGDSD